MATVILWVVLFVVANIPEGRVASSFKVEVTTVYLFYFSPHRLDGSVRIQWSTVFYLRLDR
jgi:hypothetical protein